MNKSNFRAPECKFQDPPAPFLLLDGQVVQGYASVFGRRDQGGDTVVRGAYAKSIRRLKDENRGIKMLWQHDPTQPIGVWDEVHEDQTGLWVKGRVLLDVEKGREAAALMAAGALDGLSIGYRTIRAERDKKGHRLLHEIDLWEVSLVTFPMQTEARIAAKSFHQLPSAVLQQMTQAFENARKDWTLKT